MRNTLKTQPDNQQARMVLSSLLSAEHIRIAAESGIFISYNRIDEIFAIDLALDLRDAGVNVWLDMIDISPDGDWSVCVNQAMDTCGLMLTIVTRVALQDIQMNNEMQFFLKSGKPVIPLLKQTVNIDPLQLEVPPVDFRNSYDIALHDLLTMLRPLG